MTEERDPELEQLLKLFRKDLPTRDETLSWKASLLSKQEQLRGLKQPLYLRLLNLQTASALALGLILGLAIQYRAGSSAADEEKNYEANATVQYVSVNSGSEGQ